jgi:septum formation protein
LSGTPFVAGTIVLASGSATRRAMLAAAGVPAIVDRPAVDEDVVKRHCKGRGLDAAETARALAHAKAAEVAPRHPGRIVIGADQMLGCDGEWFDKPADLAAAARQIARLAGRTHHLISAVVAVRDGQILWQAADAAALTLRPLSPAAIDDYLARAGEPVLQSVGAYQVEGLGIQLFSRIAGDHFTILGLPLLPLLDFLRSEGVIAT